MRLHVGDKVRFLNEAIEGIVSKILSNDRVEIRTTEGFLQTAFEQQLVKVEFSMEEKVVENAEADDVEITVKRKKLEEIPNPVMPARLPIIPSLENDETIYMAIVLEHERSPLTSDIEVTLVNNCSYSIVFSLSKKKDDIRSGAAAGILKSKAEQFIGAFSQDELHKFDGFFLEMLFFSDKDYIPKPPFEKHLVFSSTDFVKHEYWEILKGREDQVLLMPIYVVNQERDINVKKLLERYQQKDDEDKARAETYTKSSKGKLRPQKFVLLTKEKVVDLHIEELVKDFSDMSNAQIISYQLNYFLYEMDQAVLNKLNKITFIHGVGQGVLKSAIREQLKKYPNIRYREAPAEKYGYGATEVEFI
jgi:hypothetical protein